LLARWCSQARERAALHRQPAAPLDFQGGFQGGLGGFQHAKGGRETKSDPVVGNQLLGVKTGSICSPYPIIRYASVFLPPAWRRWRKTEHHGQGGLSSTTLPAGQQLCTPRCQLREICPGRLELRDRRWHRNSLLMDVAFPSSNLQGSDGAPELRFIMRRSHFLPAEGRAGPALCPGTFHYQESVADDCFLHGMKLFFFLDLQLRLTLEMCAS
jgi:hypothetical protein